MLHTIAYELSGSEAALTAVTPVPDPTLRVSGNDFFVPPDLPNIVCAAGMINSATATLRMQIQSPSLRATLNIDLSPINNGLVFGSLPRLVRAWNSPFGLKGGEPLDVFVQNGAAVMNRALLWLSDGAVKPVNGNIFTVRATASATLVTASWVNSALTFQQTLPAGDYQCVGARMWSANGVASRLFFVGGAYRPGFPMLNAEDNNEWSDFRMGNIGVLGQFNNVVPPTVDFLGVTDTAEVVFLDLIKVK